jgi:hypothetical protein
LHDEVIIELIVVEIVIYGGHNARIQATVGEIFQIDASWAEKLMKTRVSKILSPTVWSRPRGVALMRRPTVSSSPLMNI